MDERIEEIEKLLVKPKEWKYAGEVDVRKRPKNSLLEQEEIDFKQGPPLVPFSSKQDSEIESITLQRIREGTFDNHEYNVKEVVEIADELPDTDDLECKDILSLYNEIEGDLMQIVDFGNNGFVPDCEIRIVQGKESSSGTKKKLDVKSLDRIRNVTVLKKS
ncbi:U3 small nucleolar RNA-associated protein [Encephalitozoon hellem]|nr:U3 small nucleolar RNA-associated protein [Encephalitozoon hellem]